MNFKRENQQYFSDGTNIFPFKHVYRARMWSSGNIDVFVDMNNHLTIHQSAPESQRQMNLYLDWLEKESKNSFNKLNI